MKCLTIRQPFASMVVFGAKVYETRTWPTDYRGPLLIHAAGTVDAQAMGQIDVLGMPTILVNADFRDQRDFPRAAIIGIVTVEGCERASDVYKKISFCESAWGNYGPGFFAWKLANPRPIDPIRCGGHLGLWTPSEKILHMAQIGSKRQHQLS